MRHASALLNRILLSGVLAGWLAACSGPNSTSAATKSLTAEQTDATARIAAVPPTTTVPAPVAPPYDYSVSVKPRNQFNCGAQDCTMACWATGLAMLYSWKYNDESITIPDVVKKYGDIYSVLLETNAGIQADMETKLYKAVGLTVEKSVNPTLDRWYQLLKTRGPLSVTVGIKRQTNPSRRDIHALVITKIQGDGTASGTNFTFIDPGGARVITLPFDKFVKLYEDGSPYPLQLIYW